MKAKFLILAMMLDNCELPTSDTSSVDPEDTKNPDTGNISSRDFAPLKAGNVWVYSFVSFNEFVNSEFGSSCDQSMDITVSLLASSSTDDAFIYPASIHKKGKRRTIQANNGVHDTIDSQIDTTWPDTFWEFKAKKQITLLNDTLPLFLSHTAPENETYLVNGDYNYAPPYESYKNLVWAVYRNWSLIYRANIGLIFGEFYLQQSHIFGHYRYTLKSFNGTSFDTSSIGQSSR